MKRSLTYGLITVLVLTASSLFAQQLPHYSQFMLNQYAINPAVGGSKPYFEVRSINRYQWVGITDAPRTYALSLNGPSGSGKVGYGGFLYTDNVGPTRRTGAQLSYAYHVKLQEKTKLSFGLSFGVHQFMVDAHKITLRDEADAVLGQGLISTTVPDAKFGVYLYGDRFFVGAAAPQLMHNKLEKLVTSTVLIGRMEEHYFLTGGYDFIVNDDFVVQPSAIIKYNPPAPVQFDIATRFIYDQKLWAGVSYRSMDAVSVMAGFVYSETMLFGYSYDLTTTNLGNYNSGSHEVLLGVKFIQKKYKKRGSSRAILN